MYCVCVSVYTHIYMCEGQRQLSGLGLPLAPCGIQDHSSLDMVGSALPPEPSDQTPSFVVSSEKLLHCLLTDRQLSPESFPFVLADMELFPWG